MSNYYDSFGMLRPSIGHDGENDIVFTAYEDVYRDIGRERAHLILYLHLDKSGYIKQTPLDGRLASHDNITAFLYLANKYGFPYKLKLKQILLKYWHPRDIIFMFSIKNNPFLIFNVFPNKKVAPNIFSRTWIKLRGTYEHTVTLPNGSQEYYRMPSGEGVVIERSNEQADGKLLNLLRIKKTGAGLLSKLAHFIAKRYFDSNYLHKWFNIYFNGDANHPMIALSKSEERSYID